MAKITTQVVGNPGPVISDGRMDQRYMAKTRGNGMTKEELKAKLPSMEAYDKETLVGIFKNNEIKGGAVKFQFKKYKGDQFEIGWHLEDGKTYRLPRYIVNHINNDTSYIEFARPDGTFGEAHEIRNAGIAAQGDGRIQPLEGKLDSRKVKRFEFYSLDFNAQDAAYGQGNGINLPLHI